MQFPGKTREPNSSSNSNIIAGKSQEDYQINRQQNLQHTWGIAGYLEFTLCIVHTWGTY